MWLGGPLYFSAAIRATRRVRARLLLPTHTDDRTPLNGSESAAIYDTVVPLVGLSPETRVGPCASLLARLRKVEVSEIWDAYGAPQLTDHLPCPVPEIVRQGTGLQLPAIALGAPHVVVYTQLV
jgi:hypothetical protein